MTLHKRIKDRAIHGYPTISIEDVRHDFVEAYHALMEIDRNFSAFSNFSMKS